MQTPLRQIAENAGEDGAVIAGKMLDKDEYNWGFDAQTGEFKDLVKAGIIDPTKVVRTALQNAASVAGLLVTTEAMVAEKPEKKGPADAAGWRRHGRHGFLIRIFVATRKGAGRRVRPFLFVHHRAPRHIRRVTWTKSIACPIRVAKLPFGNCAAYSAALPCRQPIDLRLHRRTRPGR